jgi:chaperonin GroES|tara:strand:- start:875 stop:1168 length:294 start_codon:yes stop_codon:yes gene_type:complete
MKFNPLGDKLLVRRSEEEETTAGGIVLPGSAAEKPSQGEVLAIGPGRVLDSGEKVEVPVNVGDTIVFGQYAGSNTIKVDGEELLILSESDLLGTVSK